MMGIGVGDMEDESIKLFFSYSHKDEILRNELANHLRILTREGVISSWHDGEILPGDGWDNQIQDHLKTADIVLLLISVDFIASDYCNDIEVQTALQRHEAGALCVIPIILRPVDWTRAPFSKLQVLPTNSKPVTSWPDRDEAFLDVELGIRKVAETLRAQRKQKWEEKQNALDQYKQKVEEILSSSRGHISVIARDTLRELCEALGLTPKEAQDIETHAFKPYHEYEDNLKRYEQTFRKVSPQYPFSEEIKRDLEYRQRDLGIKPEDVEQIEQLILAEAEAQRQQEVERARQHERQMQRDKEEAEHARQQELQAQRDQESLQAAQVKTERQQEAERARQRTLQQQHDKEEYKNKLHTSTQPSRSSRFSSITKTRLFIGGGIIVALLLAFSWLLRVEVKTEKFTLINVLLDGTKIWLPSTFIVQQGDDVALTLINELDEPHGFKIEAFGVEEVVQPKAQTTVKFTASKPGAHSYICHIHPPHIGGSILVMSK